MNFCLECLVIRFAHFIFSSYNLHFVHFLLYCAYCPFIILLFFFVRLIIKSSFLQFIDVKIIVVAMDLLLIIKHGSFALNL
jgi:hypothetical protein